MLKNGNYIPSTNLCPCPYEPNPSGLKLKVGNNLPMNQPRVIHSYTDDTYHGYFEGTWDINASMDDINIYSNISYFKLEWEYDPNTLEPIFVAVN